MENLRAIWMGLEPLKKGVLVLAVIAAIAAVAGLARMASSPGMALLYSGLDGRQAGEIVAALDQQGAVYEVRGDAIFVDAGARDALRMTLAGQGLPANTGAGYELLDALSGFGTTSQMFDAAYWRAKEGELARTILSSPFVQQARVHIANPSPGPFRGNQDTTASVTLTTNGGVLPDAAADAFRFLIASAVQGLSPGDVAVIDATTGRIIGVDGEGADVAMAADQAARLTARVERILSARVGTGNAVVEMSVETVTDAESIVERTIDPESRIAISTDIEEITSVESDSGSNAVTVASNLPDGDAAAGQGQSQSQNSETRALTNYDISETRREIERRPGAIKRLTVAVMLNSSALLGENADADAIAAELQDLRALVEDTVGFDEARGDRITVRSMAFEPVEAVGTEGQLSLWQQLALSPMRLIQLAVLALVALALGLFVVRPILRSNASAPLDVGVPSLVEGRTSPPLIGATALPQRQDVGPTALDLAETPGSGDLFPVPMGDIFEPTALDADDRQVPTSPVDQLKQLIEDRQPDTIEILRTWLEDDTIEERA